MKFDLRSDTFTKPTAEMLAVMLQADVGDDVFGEDPTINALQEKMAEMFGKEAGLFCPSGTMTNQIGLGVHLTPGDEVICHKDSHIFRYEGAGIAANSSAQVFTLDGENGKFTVADLKSAIHSDDSHYPKSRVLSIENTVNKAGGAIWKLPEVDPLIEVARENRLKTHLDGARLFNALVETNGKPKDWGARFNTISICLSKGLGCPVGSVLLGSKEDINQAHRIRKRTGGGMRQAGYLAAAGIYALENHVERLVYDHELARNLASVVGNQSWITRVLPVQSNIVIFFLKKASLTHKLLDHLKKYNILALPFGSDSIRFVTHLDVSSKVVSALKEAVYSFEYE